MMSNHTLPRLNHLAASIAVVVGGLAIMPAAYAAAPNAGTNISNVATASYNDATNTPRTVTSNEVKTTVLQVASFLLEADRTTTANPNGQVSLPHTLTNNGNGSDTFTLNLTNQGGDDYDFSNIAIYLDANKDGIPDNNTNLIGQTISLAAGESVGLVVVGTTANTATNGNAGLLQVTATNVFSTTLAGGSNAATTAANNDTVNIVTGAVIQVVKAANVTNVDPNGTVAQRTVEYTLTYKNTGNSAATNVTLADVLPANVTYVPGSGVWSGSATARTDGTGDEVGAAYDFTSNTVNFVLGTVAQNTTGTLKFKVVVDATAPAGDIPNTATVDPDGPGGQPSQPSNTTIVTVDPVLTGTINDSQTDAFADGVAPSAPVGTKDDVITATTSQGVAVKFGNNGGETIWIHNTGNVTETYNLGINKADLPAGSIVEILKADGVTPLTDTNGDPIVDTGPIAAGGSLQIVVRVTLPSTYAGPATVANPLDTIVTIIPLNNTSAIDTLKLSITAITAARVDLSNGAGDENGIKDDTPNAGEGAYIAADIVDTKTTAPGVPTTFPLAVTNFGTNPDNFNISSDLPSGWTVKYFTANAAGVCSTNQVTNTGNILPGQTAYLCAQVTPPANATPADSRDVVFTVSSAATGLTDSIKDHVIVDEVRNITITPDRQGQVAPGGTIVYTHTLTNTGNVSEGVGPSTLPFSITHTGSLSGAVTTVYVDLNNNGIADPTELVTGNDLSALLGGTPGGAGLQPNEAVTILVKVEAPSNATAGQEDNSTLVVTPTGIINDAAPSPAVQVLDKTTVNDGQVRLTKQQALDTACDGTPDTAYGVAVLQAKPGTCISYQITAVNDGNAPVTNVVISDTIPAYTVLQNPPVPALNPIAKGTVTLNGTSLSSTSFGLAPLESVGLNFTVKIND